MWRVPGTMASPSCSHEREAGEEVVKEQSKRPLVPIVVRISSGST